mmetsp:Transcript_21506/g.59864  ORF Transcript_21506/g.59864 Transcript_21506/m.59864 type:complete len:239 (-) Transcript_21506:4-720(-)
MPGAPIRRTPCTQEHPSSDKSARPPTPTSPSPSSSPREPSTSPPSRRTNARSSWRASLPSASGYRSPTLPLVEAKRTRPRGRRSATRPPSLSPTIPTRPCRPTTQPGHAVPTSRSENMMQDQTLREPDRKVRQGEGDDKTPTLSTVAVLHEGLPCNRRPTCSNINNLFVSVFMVYKASLSLCVERCRFLEYSGITVFQRHRSNDTRTVEPINRNLIKLCTIECATKCTLLLQRIVSGR